MKKIVVLSLAACILFGCSSCGTILGGKITDCQKTKPETGKRAVRGAALFFDIVGPLPIIAAVIDFADGGMYKPCDSKK